MSTILKALKRLEQEKECLRPAGPTPVFSQARSQRSGLVEWLSAPLILWCAVGGVIIALSLTAFYFYRQSNSRSANPAQRYARTEHAPPAKPEERTDTSDIYRVPSVKESASVVPGQAAPIPPPADEPAPAPPVAAGSSVGAPDHPRPDLAGGPATAAPPTPNRPGQRPAAISGSAEIPGRNIRDPEPVARPVAAKPAVPPIAGNSNMVPADSTEEASTTQASKKPSDAYDNTASLTDGRLKVHAIAWSPEIEDRMAVVNSRIVHEGDSVGDFFVVAIRPDDVVVREKEKGLWKVVFGRP